MKEMMLPRIQALEAMETSLGGAEGPDEKWIIITIPQTVIISKMQARTEIEAVLCADQNFAVNITGIESYLLAMDRTPSCCKQNPGTHQRADEKGGAECFHSLSAEMFQD
jgi:hypothetical protein